jgi:hypothetical protein
LALKPWALQVDDDPSLARLYIEAIIRLELRKRFGKAFFELGYEGLVELEPSNQSLSKLASKFSV